MEKTIPLALAALDAGGILLYPTDTIWGLGCDAANSAAVDKIYALKQRDHSKSMLVLCSDLEMVRRFIAPVDSRSELLLANSERPTTVVMPLQRNLLATNLTAADGTIGVRIPRMEFCKSLIEALGRPLVSTSANLSGQPSPICHADISDKLKASVDYCVPAEYEQPSSGQSSRIIKLLDNGETLVIRE